jgi:hypothetical protein
MKSIEAQVKAMSAKFKKTRERTLRLGDFRRYLLMSPSHKRLKAFRKITRLLPDDQYWPLLGEVWSGVEVIRPDQKAWLRWFRSKRPGREALMTEDEWKALAAGNGGCPGPWIAPAPSSSQDIVAVASSALDRSGWRHAVRRGCNVSEIKSPRLFLRA